jgi:hypothetical protein
MPRLKTENLLKLALILAALPCALAQPLGVDVAWAPVTDAELKTNSPVVDKNAGVEALFWRVYVMDEQRGEDVERIMYHYVRLKVFNEEGKEKASTINIRHFGETVITSVTGRTIKPDGSILELSKDAVHETVIRKLGRMKWKATSFAMPGVEAGSIVEYRYQELPRDSRIMYMPLQLQLEFPVRKVTYFLKPQESFYVNYRLNVLPFNCELPPLKREANDFNSTTLENVPAFQEEPMMPSEEDVRSWALLRYLDPNENGPRKPEKYWPAVAKKYGDRLKDALRSSSEIKEMAAKATAGVTTQEDKVVALIRSLRANVRNMNDRRVGDAERAQVIKKMPKYGMRTAPEILKSGLGYDDELNLLFAQLASEAGLEAHPAFVASRDRLAFNERMTDIYFLPNIDMAVKIGDQWKIYDVSRSRLPARMLSWQEEGQKVLVTGLKTATFIATPFSAADDSLTSRKATLTLAADGSIDGDADESWTGHAAEIRRADFSGQSEARQQEIVKEELLRTNKQAEITGIKVENAENPEEPLRVRYHIRIADYAQRTGKRLLLQPVFFERGSAPLFSSGDRHYNISFPHLWRESEQVTIALPPGFLLEKADSPGGLDFGEPGSYKLTLSVRGKSELTCARELVWGNEHYLTLKREAYPSVKGVFDEIHRRDGYMLSLRQAQ